MLDYYTILQVKSDASQDDIKKAYKVLARTWHPDKNRDNEKEATRRFKEISEAYTILSNPSQRREYDLKRSRPTPEKPRRSRRDHRFDAGFPRPEFTSFDSDFSRGDGAENRRSRFRSTRRNPEFRRVHVNPEDLFKDFFEHDPFKDFFNLGRTGSGLFPDRSSQKTSRNLRSRSLFRDPFLGHGRSKIFEEFEEMDRIFENMFPFTAQSHRFRS
jgi:curved DNA-binding protein CbpA